MHYRYSIPLVLVLLHGCSDRFYGSDRFYEYKGQRIRIYTGIESTKHESNVQAIDLRNNALQSLPKEVGKFSELILLDARDNQLTSIDAHLCDLTNLKVFLIGSNPLVELPNCLFDMTQLEILTLFGCKLDISRERFAKLTNLRILGLGGNNFTEEDLIYLKEQLPNCNIVVAVD